MLVKVGFGTHEVVFQTLDSPITNIWAECLNKWNNLNIPTKTQTIVAPFFGTADTYTEKYIVDNINKAIDDANSFIKGKKFPYKAYLDMPWQQTNLLHRCFTTADIGRINWKHNFNFNQLLKGKKESYRDKHLFLQGNSDKEYTISDEVQFEEAIHRVNKWVHHYEDLRVSGRSKRLFDNHIKKAHNWHYSVLEIEWDNYDPSGMREWHGVSRVSYNDLKTTHSLSNANSCNIFISVNITGKDYETSYYNYDDLLEYDTTNLDLVNGGVRIYNSSYLDYLYGKNGEISNLALDLGIDLDLVKPVPLGRVVKSNVDYSKISYSDTDLYTDGTPAAEGIFRNPTITIVDEKNSNNLT